MTVNLKPEVEAIVTRDVARGPYQSVDEFVERAVELLHLQEEWFAQNQSAIGNLIEEGYAAAQRGELLTPEDVRSGLEQKKAAWFARHKPE